MSHKTKKNVPQWSVFFIQLLLQKLQNSFCSNNSSLVNKFFLNVYRASRGFFTYLCVFTCMLILLMGYLRTHASAKASVRNIPLYSITVHKLLIINYLRISINKKKKNSFCSNN